MIPFDMINDLNQISTKDGKRLFWITETLNFDLGRVHAM